nr:MAG TPA: protein of unknown function (DUF4330) [Caudoviricetes sp.]
MSYFQSVICFSIIDIDLLLVCVGVIAYALFFYPLDCFV